MRLHKSFSEEVTDMGLYKGFLQKECVAVSVDICPHFALLSQEIHFMKFKNNRPGLILFQVQKHGKGFMLI